MERQKKSGCGQEKITEIKRGRKKSGSCRKKIRETKGAIAIGSI